MGRSGNAKRGHGQVNSARVTNRASLTFRVWQARRQVARGSTSAEVLDAARAAAALGERELAVALVADVLESDARELLNRRAYVPGEVMARVLGALAIDVDAASREYAPLIARVMPDAPAMLAPESPLRTLARQDLEPLPMAEIVSDGASRVVAGEPYETVHAAMAAKLTRETARARDREVDWLTAQLRLRYDPGNDGLGRLWANAASNVTPPPSPGFLLSHAATLQAVVGLAVARSADDASAALAQALARR